jgi:hypothetical protein
MSQFEFIFTLYSLLLGLSLVELISGLGRTLKARLVIDDLGTIASKIGWLTPLLAFFVMLDLLSFWAAAWAVRDIAIVTGPTLIAVMLFASSYYLAAQLVFPDVIPKNGDLDQHYFRVKRIVFGIMLVLLLLQLGFYLSQAELAERISQPVTIGMTVILVSLMIAASLAKSKTANIILLFALVCRYLIVYLI